MSFHPIANAIAQLKARSAILDEEVGAMKGRLGGVPRTAAPGSRAMPDIFHQAFDLLWLDGEDLRLFPRIERLVEASTSRARRRAALPMLVPSRMSGG